MFVGLHDSEKEHFKHKKTFPNYALMKISAYHKAKGDSVEWWDPAKDYDLVYSSKIFDFTEENKDLPPDTIKGGTGYDIEKFQSTPPMRGATQKLHICKQICILICAKLPKI